jgi:hypothetical protein
MLVYVRESDVPKVCKDVPLESAPLGKWWRAKCCCGRLPDTVQRFARSQGHDELYNGGDDDDDDDDV